MTMEKTMARKKEDKTQVNLKLPDQLVERIKIDAIKQKRPFSSQVEYLIEKGYTVVMKEESIFERVKEEMKDAG